MQKIKKNREKLIKLAKALYILKLRKILDPIKYFNPQQYQLAFWLSFLKIKLIFGGNRSGKTMNGAAYIIRKCLKNPGTKAWCCTWAKLSVSIQQKKIKDLLPIEKINYAKWTEQRGFTHRIIIFKNDSVIRFKTYEEGASKFQGAAQHIIWNDEELPEDVYKEQTARLIDYDGEMIITMTPINGITWIYTNIVKNKKLTGKFDYWFWPTSENKKINQKGFERIISQYAPKEAEVRSLGHFVNLNSGRLYYAFDREINVKRLKVNPNLPLLLSFDFNVNPMTTSIFQIVDGNGLTEQFKILNLIETINTPDCNTRMQCKILKKKLSNWKGEIIIYGDASNQRRTETADINTTNWTIVKEYFPYAEYKVPDGVNPNIKERVAWVNAKIYNFDNKIGFYINDIGCNEMILDLEQGVWAANQKEKDKSNPKLNHNSDNLDYIIAEEFKLNDFDPAYESENIPDERINLTEKMGFKRERIKIFN